MPTNDIQFNAANTGDYAFLPNGWEIAIRPGGDIYALRSIGGSRPMFAFQLNGTIACCTGMDYATNPKPKRLCASFGATEEVSVISNRQCFRMKL